MKIGDRVYVAGYIDEIRKDVVIIRNDSGYFGTEKHNVFVAESVKEMEEKSGLIRCKDCEFWENKNDSLQGRCALLQMYPTGEWYCANAERKEE